MTRIFTTTTTTTTALATMTHALLLSTATSFTILPQTPHLHSTPILPTFQTRHHSHIITTRHATNTDNPPPFTYPTQDEATAMGIREWPQQTKSSPEWTEEASENQLLTRYILQGSGTLEVVEGNSQSLKEQQCPFEPGLLVQVPGPAVLRWKKKGGAKGEEVIVLTPGFEEGGALAGVAIGLVLLCGALIAGVGS